MRRYQLNRRSSHGDPNVHKDEVNRPVNPLERLTKVAFTKIDELAYAALAKFARAASAFFGSYSVPITTPSTPYSARLARTAAAR